MMNEMNKSVKNDKGIKIVKYRRKILTIVFFFFFVSLTMCIFAQIFKHYDEK